jgi:hypothetical protein
MLILVAVYYVVPLLSRMVRRENAGWVVRPQGHGHLTACVQEGESRTTWEVEAVVLVMPHQCSSCYDAFPHWLQPPPIHHHPGGTPWVHLVHKEALNCGIRCHSLCLPSYASRLVVVHTQMGIVISFPHGGRARRELVSGVLGTHIGLHTIILVENWYMTTYAVHSIKGANGSHKRHNGRRTLISLVIVCQIFCSSLNSLPLLGFHSEMSANRRSPLLCP